MTSLARSLGGIARRLRSTLGCVSAVAVGVAARAEEGPGSPALRVSRSPALGGLDWHERHKESTTTAPIALTDCRLIAYRTDASNSCKVGLWRVAAKTGTPLRGLGADAISPSPRARYPNTDSAGARPRLRTVELPNTCGSSGGSSCSKRERMSRLACGCSRSRAINARRSSPRANNP
jgi:hypothetical protein